MSQLARSLEDVQTELVIQTFADRTLILITQVGKVGTLIQASIPPTAPLLLRLPNSYSEDATNTSNTLESLPLPSPSIQLTPLLGRASTEHTQTLHSLYASQIATLVWIAEQGTEEERKPIIVGIALKKSSIWDEEKERRTFMGVMQMIIELLGKRRKNLIADEDTDT